MEILISKLKEFYNGLEEVYGTIAEDNNYSRYSFTHPSLDLLSDIVNEIEDIINGHAKLDCPKCNLPHYYNSPVGFRCSLCD